MSEKFRGKYRVESIRLKNWNYGNSGYYFVTICVKYLECVFGNICNGEMILSETGNIAKKFWMEIPEHFSFVKLDEFIIMPNHVHGVIIIDKKDDRINTGFPKFVETRHCLVSGGGDSGDDHDFNSSGGDSDPIETRQCLVSTDVKDINKNFTNSKNPRFQNQGRNTLSSIIGSYKSICTKMINKIQNDFHFQWQPGFYDHIIRDEKSLLKIREYIKNNPLKWDEDEENPDRRTKI